jgi:hypothetical protein
VAEKEEGLAMWPKRKKAACADLTSIDEYPDAVMA